MNIYYKINQQKDGELNSIDEEDLRRISFNEPFKSSIGDGVEYPLYLNIEKHLSIYSASESNSGVMSINDYNKLKEFGNANEYSKTVEYRQWIEDNYYSKTLSDNRYIVKSNLAGTGSRLVQVDNLGNPTATIIFKEQYVGASETVLIELITGATYNANGMANVSSSTIFEKGRIYVNASTGYKYEAFEDNSILRTKGI